MKIIKKAVPFVIAAGILTGSVALASHSPKLFRLSSYKGTIGQRIKVTGMNFGKQEGEIKFDGVEDVAVDHWSRHKVYFRVPNIAEGKSYNVRVCRKDEDCTKSQKFYVKRSGPELWRIKNLSDGDNYQGVPGDRLKLTGLNFDAKNIAVKFGSANAQILKRTKKVIEVRVPDIERNKTYAVFVTDGTHDSNSQDFFIKP